MSDEPLDASRPPWEMPGHVGRVAQVVTFFAQATMAANQAKQRRGDDSWSRSELADAAVQFAAMIVAAMHVVAPEDDAQIAAFHQHLSQRLIDAEREARPNLAMHHAEKTLSRTGQLGRGSDTPQ